MLILTCPASLPYSNQRIRDVVDDAVELVVLGVELGLVLGYNFPFPFFTETLSSFFHLPNAGFDPTNEKFESND